MQELSEISDKDMSDILGDDFAKMMPLRRVPRVGPYLEKKIRQANDRPTMRIHTMITPLEDLREGQSSVSNVPVVKAVMDSIGLAGGYCRPPIHKLTEVERQAAVDAISGWGF
jgi:dihydrodipicolinate synthase/N-acetylneuraminate lyase